MPAFIFDLDGTLIDSVYAHILAWQQAIGEADIPVDAWHIHRRIGMSGTVLLHALCQELGCQVSSTQADQIEKRHAELYPSFQHEHRPLRGAVKLIAKLRAAQIPFGIATSGSRPGIDPSLKALGIERDVVVVEGKEVGHPKPEPDEFLRCQQTLGVRTDECFVVGDAVWDLLAAGRARMFSIGLLSGGNSAEELFKAGAFRVFADTEELRESLYQLGIA
jgi:HAD superfamily hydrolase (TIGR01509 family)